MASVNKIILIGNVGNYPESRSTSSGMAVTTVSLATTTKRKDSEETQWHRITFYDKLAGIASEYVKKGSPIYVEGSLKYGKYTDKNGQDRYTTDIIANSLQLLGGRQSEAPAKPRKELASAGSGFDEIDNDLPFVSFDVSHDMVTSKSRRMSGYDY